MLSFTIFALIVTFAINNKIRDAKRSHIIERFGSECSQLLTASEQEELISDIVGQSLNGLVMNERADANCFASLLFRQRIFLSIYANRMEAEVVIESGWRLKLYFSQIRNELSVTIESFMCGQMLYKRSKRLSFALPLLSHFSIKVNSNVPTSVVSKIASQNDRPIFNWGVVLLIPQHPDLRMKRSVGTLWENPYDTGLK